MIWQAVSDNQAQRNVIGKLEWLTTEAGSMFTSLSQAAVARQCFDG
jgi:hypothetical protein